MGEEKEDRVIFRICSERGSSGIRVVAGFRGCLQDINASVVSSSTGARPNLQNQVNVLIGKNGDYYLRWW